MYMRRHPLNHQHGGKQKKNQRCVKSLFDHNHINFKIVSEVDAFAAHGFALYTDESRSGARIRFNAIKFPMADTIRTLCVHISFGAHGAPYGKRVLP